MINQISQNISPYLNAPLDQSTASQAQNVAANSQNSDNSVATSDQGSDKPRNPSNPVEMTPDEKAVLAQLQQTDTEVRTHEAAHMAAGAGLTKGVSYTFEKGPDNQMYAVAGEVGIDTSPSNTPSETIAKAQQIRRAALAPSNPSSADLQVAASASQMEQAAKAELAAQNKQEQEQKTDNSSDDATKDSENSSASGDGDFGMPTFSPPPPIASGGGSLKTSYESALTQAGSAFDKRG